MASKIFLALIVLTTTLFTAAISAQQPAPMFDGSDMTTGDAVNLADYQGKVIFVDFWASWCPPCLLSLPAYNQMRSELGTEEFEIIAVNVDENTSNGEEFLLDNPVDYPVLADPDGTIGIPYGVRSLPVSFLLDKSGNIVKTYKGYKPGDETQMARDILDLIGS